MKVWATRPDAPRLVADHSSGSFVFAIDRRAHPCTSIGAPTSRDDGRIEDDPIPVARGPRGPRHAPPRHRATVTRRKRRAPVLGDEDARSVPRVSQERSARDAQAARGCPTEGAPRHRDPSEGPEPRRQVDLDEEGAGRRIDGRDDLRDRAFERPIAQRRDRGPARSARNRRSPVRLPRGRRPGAGSGSHPRSSSAAAPAPPGRRPRRDGRPRARRRGPRSLRSCGRSLPCDTPPRPA